MSYLQLEKDVLDGEVRLLEKSKEIVCLKEALNDLQKKLDTVRRIDAERGAN